MRISDGDRRRVQAAIADAERRTSGDFICVAARNASDYSFYPLAWATLLALVAPWALLATTALPFADILLAQLAVFAVAHLVFGLPAVRRYVVPRRVQRAAAHRAATEQFFIHGLANTPDRRGVLIYLADAEHYARVLADDGADGVSENDWREAIALLVAGARAGRHADGFVAALTHCGAVMGKAHPAEGQKPNALADKFHVV